MAADDAVAVGVEPHERGHRVRRTDTPHVEQLLELRLADGVVPVAVHDVEDGVRNAFDHIEAAVVHARRTVRVAELLPVQTFDGMRFSINVPNFGGLPTPGRWQR
ncbi:hypothetical protein ORV05_15170 [Amycolatopsis cynarae]|uniref:Uncharacterized protein n=1 Tax=Amycolatopsis cynarae TaxID=2995223 RepID=A0ABY7BA68_9PSEU|nr:hypothetical protein [Amycolatopsis sp. HUAS 11-8]WAL69051.1 hypothetical protein ORV05_15170 [Amycolatopsis sp. HUAS 11-8]